MTYNKKEREYYNQRRESVCEALGITKNEYNWFRREGEKLHKIYENNCNGLYADELAYEVAEAEADNELLKRIEAKGLFIYLQTDPRGATIYLDRKPIPENNYTTAYCIY